MKKHIIIAILSLGLVSSTVQIEPVEPFKTVLRATSEEVEEEPITSEEEPVEDDTSATEDNTNQYADLKDEDKNGIPDIWEEAWTDTTFYKVLGVSLATLVTLCINVIGLIYQSVKYKSLRTGLKKQAEISTQSINAFTAKSEDTINTFSKENLEIRAKLEEEVNQYTNLMTQYKAMTDANNQATERLTSTIKAQEEYIRELTEKNATLAKCYDGLNTKMNNILENQIKLATQDENLISSGLAREIVESSEDALKYEKSE